jgi:uncharacterized membrane protein YozB (DUF420 family)
MMARSWLYVGTALDLILLAAAFYMAVSAVDVVSRSDRSPIAIGVAIVFLLFPVFCIAAIAAAWRAEKRRRAGYRTAAMFVAPWIYGVFLVVFLNYG